MFAAVFIPDFFAEAILRTRGALRHTAVAIVEGTPPLAYVVATNTRARQLGIANGMTKLQADGFTAQGRGAVIQRSRAAEASAHAALLDAAHSVSPKVEDTAEDTVVLDASGLERLFGTSQQIARELARRISDQGLETNIAIAASPEVAICAARGFTGVTIIEPGEEAERLGPLPLEVLFEAEASAVRTGHTGAARKTKDDTRQALDRLTRMQEVFERWGVRNFRALASLPPASLSERLGRHGVRLQKLACGAICREIVLTEPPLVFEEAVELESAVEAIEPLLFVLSGMIEQVCARLSTRALCANELRLRMKLERCAGDDVALSREELDALGNGTIIERKLTLPVAMNDPKLFLKLLNLQFSAQPPGAPVVKIWLTAEAAPPRIGQAGLFMPLAPEPEKLELTLARLHKLLSAMPGANSATELRAGCAELLDSHAPEAFRMVRFRTPESSADKADMETQPSTTAKPTLALRRMRPPATAAVEMRDGHPARVNADCLSTRAVTHDNVVWSAGPWRASGHWWAAPENTMSSDLGRTPSMPSATVHSWTREEWDVAIAVTQQQPRQTYFDGAQVHKAGGRRSRTTHIALYRITHDPTTGQWHIEGSYD